MTCVKQNSTKIRETIFFCRFVWVFLSPRNSGNLKESTQSINCSDKFSTVQALRMFLSFVLIYFSRFLACIGFALTSSSRFTKCIWTECKFLKIFKFAEGQVWLPIDFPPMWRLARTFPEQYSIDLAIDVFLHWCAYTFPEVKWFDSIKMSLYQQLMGFEEIAMNLKLLLCCMEKEYRVFFSIFVARFLIFKLLGLPPDLV